MMTTQEVNDTPKINGQDKKRSDMNPTKVQTATKRNPETVQDDNPGSK